MVSSFLSTNRFRLIFAAAWLIWMSLHTLILNWLELDWTVASIDAAVSNILLLLASLIISNTLRYYLPEQNYLQIGVWCLLLTALWLLGSRWILVNLQEKNLFYLDLMEKSLPVRFCIGFLMISWMALISMLWYTLQDQKETTQRKADAERLLRDAELYKLRQQLQPHFLFNSLNSISALIGKKPEKAQAMIYQLSDFLRGTLRKEENEFITLDEELQHLQLYLEIEKVRFGHRLAADTEQEEGCGQLKLPAMLLQPLVENAIKFGLYDTLGAVEIKISASCRDNELVVAIRNPYNPESGSRRSGSGFGLSGIRRRLYLLFARNDLLETREEDTTFITTVKIPQ